MRNLIIVLGDQLDPGSAAFDGFDRAQDTVWMAEAPRELTHVWCHKLRIAFFLSAMRHFRDDLAHRGIRVVYNTLAARPADDAGEGLADLLKRDIGRLRPERLVLVEPGDHRVLAELRGAADTLGIAAELRPDRSFLCSREEFQAYTERHRGFLLETFYRTMRIKHRILLQTNGKPIGGQWNYDKANRKSFGRRGPGPIPAMPRHPIDTVTRGVLDLVAARFADHPGSLDDFDLPVTRAQARDLLAHFIETCLASFGTHQDAMWSGEPFLYHSRLSAAMNVKLLNAREVVDAALAAYEQGEAPLAAVEGFVRQVIGWREFVRGLYWHFMPRYAEHNALGGTLPVPRAYWDGETDMNCVRHSMTGVSRHAYAHHIQRLMVFGNYAMMLGVDPQRFNGWHLAMYADAIDWVSLPNTLGMSQHADGGIVGTKPYCATGAYIDRMSDYCRGCRYDPKKSVGDDACPFTTLFWDFLARHRARFVRNTRMVMMIRNLDAKAADDMRAIRAQAERLKAETADGASVGPGS
jgi:deoxyribodipyrimidine photolyase-related protein